MKTEQPAVPSSPVPARLQRGAERMAAMVGAMVIAVFLVVMVGSLLSALYVQRRAYASANTNRLRALSTSLVSAGESLLATGDISTLRRIIAETGVGQKLDTCQLVLPDGQVIAAANPLRITLPQLPQTWDGKAGEYRESVDDGRLLVSAPLEVAGRGNLQLRLTADIHRSWSASLRAQSGLAAVGGLGLIGLLAVYRYSRKRLRAVGAIRQALLDARDGRTHVDALEVDPRFGPEAETWNRILAENRKLSEQLSVVQAQQSLAFRRGTNGDISAACDALPQGLILVGEDKQIKYANGAAAILLQRSREELVGAELPQLIRDPRVAESVEQAAAGPTTRRIVIESEREHGKGVLRYIVRPVRREDPGTAMVVIDDITQQRVAEKARNEFLAQAAHELRTPLSNIRLYVESALEDPGQDSSKQAQSFNVINEESRRLERIVSDVLSVSEIEAGSFSLRRDDVRLEALLEQAKADFEPQARERGITLNFQLPPKIPTIQGDRDKIALALHNLVGNALKYTRRGGQVTVTVTADDNEVALDVTDTGIGIDEDDREKIFEKFYRATNVRAGGSVGSGLGLAVAREVVRLHGGDITVQSEPDKGSTFTLTLPILGDAA